MSSLNPPLPKPGQTVSVITEHRQYYYNDPSEYVRHVYTGTVIKSDPGDPYMTFRITGDDKVPARIIAIRNVIRLNVDGTDVIGDHHVGSFDEPTNIFSEGEKPMTTKITSWNDRFALIDHFTPTDAQICAAFSVTPEELSTARDLRTTGTFKSNVDLDVNQYNNIFVEAPAPVASIPAAPKATKSTKTSIKSPKQKPETATKIAKKRGRSGNKIATAFAAIPTSPVPAEEFAKNQGVSLAVLRQGKRFNSNCKVHVRTNKETKVLEIWRTDLTEDTDAE